MIHSGRILRNLTVLVACQPVSWAFTLVFTIVVARQVGSSEWGVWGVAWWIGLVARASIDFGTSSVLLKEVPRKPSEASRYLGSALAIRLALTPVLVAAILAFAWLARYSVHARVVIVVVALSVALSYVEAPLTFGLQAFEKTHAAALITLASSGLLTGAAIVAARIFGLGIVAVAAIGVVAGASSMFWQWRRLAQEVDVAPLPDLRFALRLIRQGLPYWLTYLFFTIYVWADGILLSLLAPGREVGWYNASAQLIATLGFLPYSLVTAVFPALSRSYQGDPVGHAALSARSFRLLMALSIPVTAGLVVEAPNIALTIFGPDFAPAGLNLAILALSLPPVYAATLINAFVIAADRQARWAWLMGGVCVVNPLLNLLTIPYFHHVVGNGAAGTATALVVTDLATGVGAIVLLPAALRGAIAEAAPAVLRSSIAATAMVLAILPFRGAFLPIPIIAGSVIYAAAAILLRVFPSEELAVLRRVLWGRVIGARLASESEGLKAQPETAA